MGKLKSLITGAILGAGSMYVGLQYHVVQAEEGFVLVPRSPQQRLQDAYADVRDWDAATWTARPRMALAITEHGRGDLIRDGVTQNVLDSLRETIAPFHQPSTHQPSTLQPSTKGALGPATSLGSPATRGWEPASTTAAPQVRELLPPAASSAAPPPPVDRAEPRQGFLPLAKLFGMDAQQQTPSAERTLNEAARHVLPGSSSVTPILPAGVTRRKEVEILPSPGDMEFLSDPGDVNLGPSAPLPGYRGRVDRRQTDATGGWQPLTVKPF